jgi:hypothetical protein
MLGNCRKNRNNDKNDNRTNAEQQVGQRVSYICGFAFGIVGEEMTVMGVRHPSLRTGWVETGGKDARGFAAFPFPVEGRGLMSNPSGVVAWAGTDPTCGMFAIDRPRHNLRLQPVVPVLAAA